MQDKMFVIFYPLIFFAYCFLCLARFFFFQQDFVQYWYRKHNESLTKSMDVRSTQNMFLFHVQVRLKFSQVSLTHWLDIATTELLSSSSLFSVIWRNIPNNYRWPNLHQLTYIDCSLFHHWGLYYYNLLNVDNKRVMGYLTWLCYFIS